MSGGKFHVHGPHEHAAEHEAGGGHGNHDKSGANFAQWVAIFTAILATIGAIVSYQGGHTQNEALYYKNEAVLKKASASNEWAYYQASAITCSSGSRFGATDSRSACKRSKPSRYSSSKMACLSRKWV